MSDDLPVSVNSAQWQNIIEAVKGLRDHSSYWTHFLIQAAPVFLGSLLGIGSALLLDGLRTRRETRKILTERQEKDAADLLERQTRELGQLNLVSTAMGFNLENLQHIAMQQVLPHFHDSHAACTEIESLPTAEQIARFGATMSDRFPHMTTRSPEPYFFEVDFFKEIPFVLENDPEILKLSGWMTSFMRELKNNLNARNTRIDSGGRNPRGLTVVELLEHVRVQAVISNAEVVHTQQLMQQVLAICDKLREVVEQYKHINKAHLKVLSPEPLAETMAELTRIVTGIVPDFPPPEPVTQKTSS